MLEPTEIRRSSTMSAFGNFLRRSLRRHSDTSTNTSSLRRPSKSKNNDVRSSLRKHEKPIIVLTTNHISPPQPLKQQHQQPQQQQQQQQQQLRGSKSHHCGFTSGFEAYRNNCKAVAASQGGFDLRSVFRSVQWVWTTGFNLRGFSLRGY